MPFDALIVLGCRVHHGQLLQASLRRVEQAARAYHEHGARLVIASGGKLWQGTPEALVFGRGLLARGVPETCLLQERESLTTRGNALGVRELLRGRDVQTLAIVTCDWHMPRALSLFRRCGLHAVALPAPSPLRPPHLALLRSARERGSLALDAFLLRAWHGP